MPSLSHFSQELSQNPKQLGDGIDSSTGLVRCSKTDREDLPDLNITIFADLLTVTKQPVNRTEMAHGSGNGRTERPITRFTRKSRANMMRKMGKIRNLGKLWFITLTYPDSVAFNSGFDQTTFKRDLSAMRKRIARKFADAWGIWRLEPQTRKSGENLGKVAPHFHLMLMQTNINHKELYTWVTTAWYEVAHRDDEHLGRAATNVKPCAGRRHAYYYMSKYVSKEIEEAARTDENGELIEWGRWWGTFGNLDTSPGYQFTISAEDYIQLRRMAKSWMQSHGMKYAPKVTANSPLLGVSCFGLGDNEQTDHRPEGMPLIWKMLFFIFNQEVNNAMVH